MNAVPGSDDYERLRDQLDAEWNAITEARERSKQALTKARDELSHRHLVPEGTDLIAYGSIARLELTAKSDLDWTLLTDTRADPGHNKIAQSIPGIVKSLNFEPPGPTRTFGTLIGSHDLVHTIGGQDDTNKNTTRRVLLLLESVSLTGDPNLIRSRVIRSILERYIDHDPSLSWRSSNPKLVPRFLLNDIVRYWRTLAVDYASKKWDNPQKSPLKNIKLRFSRKLLFVKGVIMCLYCELNREKIFGASAPAGGDERAVAKLLTDRCARLAEVPALDLLCHMYLSFGRVTMAREVMDAYNEFLAALDDADKRKHLEELNLDEAHADKDFCSLRDASGRFTRGLGEFLFRSDEQLRALAEKYLVF